MHYDLTSKRIWVDGYRGMIGGAVVRRLANTDFSVDFLYQNLMIEANTLQAAHEVNVEMPLVSAQSDASCGKSGETC